MGTRVLPFIRDLNPKIDDLPQLVRLAHRHQGDRAKLATAIFRSWKKAGIRKGFSTHSISANTIASLGPENLGILTADGRLTHFGRALYALRKDPNGFRDALTKEVLLNHAGWQFARALHTLGQPGKRPTRQEVANYLAGKYGIEEWRDLNNISSLHSLLEWGGVVKNYRLGEAEFTRITGVALGDVQTLEAFPQDTRDCFEALVRLGGTGTAGEIRGLAEALRWRLLNVHQMPAILKPLLDAGLVEFLGKKGDKKSPYRILDSEKAAALESFATDLSLSGVVPDAIFDQTFASIVDQLKDKLLTKDQRARTLEVLLQRSAGVWVSATYRFVSAPNSKSTSSPIVPAPATTNAGLSSAKPTATRPSAPNTYSANSA